MRYRSTLAIVVALLGMCLLFCATHDPALGDDKDKGKPSEAGTPKELIPKLITLQEKEITVTKALKELATQTGNQVEDHRQVRDESTKIKLDLKNVTFWQALDAIAKGADAKVSLYERDGGIALIDGPFQALPISYSGLFRLMIKRLDAIHVIEQDAHVLNIYLDVAWEPRIQPLLMDSRPDSLVVEDDKGRALEIPEGSRGMAPVGRRNVTEVPVRLTAPRRTANTLGLFKGKMVALSPGKMLSYTFDNLTKIDKAANARKETKEGVTVHLRELRNEGEGDDQVWTVGVLLEYPADGPKFESFQSWVVNNDIYLEKEKDGIKQKFPPNLGYESDDQTENKALLRYRFGDEPEKKLILGKFSDWKLVYRTPGKIVEVPIPFEFKDVQLP